MQPRQRRPEPSPQRKLWVGDAPFQLRAAAAAKERRHVQTVAGGRADVVVVAGGGDVPPWFHHSSAPAGAFSFARFRLPTARAVGWVLTPLPRLKGRLRRSYEAAVDFRKH
jgi:hypothetical protein